MSKHCIVQPCKCQEPPRLCERVQSVRDFMLEKRLGSWAGNGLVCSLCEHQTHTCCACLLREGENAGEWQQMRVHALRGQSKTRTFPCCWLHAHWLGPDAGVAGAGVQQRASARAMWTHMAPSAPATLPPTRATRSRVRHTCSRLSSTVIVCWSAVLMHTWCGHAAHMRLTSPGMY